MKLLNTNVHGVEIHQPELVILAVKFDDAADYANLFVEAGGGHVWRGDPETNDFYHNWGEMEKNALQVHFGGPDGDLDMTKCDGRSYTILRAYMIPNVEE